MCSIFGYINFDSKKNAQKEILVKMGRSIKRGEANSSDLYIKDNVALARQPISNEDGTVYLVLNGEIYNHGYLSEELKKRGHIFKSRSDSEILLHLYEEEGIKFLDRIQGMFSFALWDMRTKDFFLVRDRLGIKPLYCYAGKDILVFASELRAILAHPATDKELDLVPMHHYFTYGYIPAPMSIFRDIEKIPPANYLHLYKNSFSLKRYWSSVPIETNGSKEKNYVEKMLYLLENSVKEQLTGNVPLGIFLSGGIDSSIISYLAASQMTDNKIKTFNISSDDPEYSESQYAKLIANYLNVEHFTKRISSKEIINNARGILELLDEPLADSSFIPTYLLSSFASEHVKVCLSGDGGDEIFAGYPTYLAQPIADGYRKVPFFMRKHIFDKLANAIPIKNSNNKIDFLLRIFLKGIDYEDVERNIIWFGPFAPHEADSLFKEKIVEYPNNNTVFTIVKEYVKNSGVLGSLERQLLVDRRFYLAGAMLTKTGQASMANSLEVRVPFLDHRIVEFSDTLPRNFKLRLFTNKYILKKVFHGKLPNKILYRKKQGFNIAIGKLLKQGLLDKFIDLLDKNAIKRQGIFDYGYIKQVISEHMRSKKDNRRQIWAIIAFQVWFNKYFKSLN